METHPQTRIFLKEIKINKIKNLGLYIKTFVKASSAILKKDEGWGMRDEGGGRRQRKIGLGFTSTSFVDLVINKDYIDVLDKEK